MFFSIVCSVLAWNSFVIGPQIAPRACAAVLCRYGAMLRESIRHERLSAALLAPSVALAAGGTFETLFRNFESAHFDVASDAYATLRDLLTKHRHVVAAFLASRCHVT